MSTAGWTEWTARTERVGWPMTRSAGCSTGCSRIAVSSVARAPTMACADATYPASPTDMSDAQQPATSAPEREPASVGDPYTPPGHEGEMKYWYCRKWWER